MVAVIWAASPVARAQWTADTRVYTLLPGSQLTDDCGICDRIPIVVPMTGTFRLRFLDETPLLTRYQILDAAFHAGTKGGPDYWVGGSGAYQAGGEVAVSQDLFLDAGIDNGVETTRALCANPDRAVTQIWPRIQASLLQTNGTDYKVYSLALLAQSALQLRALLPEPKTRSVTLQWEGAGRPVQVERATRIEGPYEPLSSITTAETFTDTGALTNRTLFYRLRQD